MTDATVNNFNKPMTYAANDWFYMKTAGGEACNNTKDVNCVKNEAAVGNLRQSTNHLGASLTQYNDAKMLYNRELLFTVNIFVGLLMLCYYIYLNQSVASSGANVNNLKSIGNTIAASLTGANKLTANPKL
jgi:hypothetical protein